VNTTSPACERNAVNPVLNFQVTDAQRCRNKEA
jgi:hypothetical protein